MDDLKLNPKERAVLAGALRDREQLTALDWTPAGVQRDQLGLHRIRIADAREGYVPMNLAGWIGHTPSPSEAVMYHRAYKRLEQRGLLHRVSLYGDGRRSTHLQLTDLGEMIASNLCAMEARP
jgi:hypothetical protein